MSGTTTLITAEQYLRMPDTGHPTELVRGGLIMMNPPSPRHGQICAKVARILGTLVEEHDLGHVLTNDSGVITARNPDTVRGADVAFYSFGRVPKGPLGSDYLTEPPELVVEVMSPSDRWKDLHLKVGEYLDAGVDCVCVLDSQSETAHVYRSEQPPAALSADEKLILPDVLSLLAIPLRSLFE